MRILKLRFKNLNSLKGEWLIDFANPSYTDNGIFAITGQTGSGKSTILDALSLALYGMTPRLDKITYSQNELMSRQSSECFAEVVFSTKHGCYRCYFSQKRGKNSLSGELQTPKHEIADAVSGKIIESHVRKVTKVVTEITGMDFHHFTRFILLAQGSFARFLQTSSEERSIILERITGAAIYSTISIKVHEETGNKKKEFELISAELSSINLLSDIEEDNLKETLNHKQKVVTKLEKDYTISLEQKSWLESIKLLEKEVFDLEASKSDFEKRKVDFRPKEIILAKANAAFLLEADYLHLNSLDKQQNLDIIKLDELKKELLIQRQKVADSEMANKNANFTLSQFKNNVVIATQLIKDTRFLDQEIIHSKESINRLTLENNNITKVLGNSDDEIKQLENKINTIKNNLKIHQAYIKEHAIDEQLGNELTLIISELKQLKLLYTDKVALQEKLSNLIESDNITDLETELTALEKTLPQLQIQINLVTEKREIAIVNINLLTKQLILEERIQSLEQLRNKLIRGEACPLCGSLEHPYSINVNLPKLDNNTEEELEQTKLNLGKINDKLKKLEYINDNFHALMAERNKIEARIAKVINYLTSILAKYRIANIDAILKKQTSFVNELQEDYMRVKKVDTNAPTFQNISTNNIIIDLKNRFNKWQENHVTVNKLNNGIQKINERKSNLLTLTDEYSKQYNSLKSQILEEQSNLDNLNNKRISLYNNKNPDIEEQKLKDEAEYLQHNVTHLEQLYQSQLQAKNIMLNNIKHQEDAIKLRSNELIMIKEQFNNDLLNADFKNIDEFIQARLDDKVRQDLNKSIKELNDNILTTNAKYEDKKINFAKKLEQAKTAVSLEKIEETIENNKANLAGLREEIGAINEKLNNNIVTKTQKDKIMLRLKKASNEYQRFKNLHELIGSHDGKKFRNFAQGLTFEIMIVHANNELRKMSDRYLLVRDKNEPLELNIIDSYQASEIRSTKNLSGGESFIVSLALALGLSKMSSQKVSMDSLFLDEGFGSLDEDTLQIALDALSNVQRSGKLIGIISHVSALKERIGVQINVESLPGGISRLHGPGVVLL